MHLVRIGNEVVNLDMVTHVSLAEADGSVKVAFPFFDLGDGGYRPQEGATIFHGDEADELRRVLANTCVGVPVVIDSVALDYNLEGAMCHVAKIMEWLADRPMGADIRVDAGIARQFLITCRDIIGPAKAELEAAR